MASNRLGKLEKKPEIALNSQDNTPALISTDEAVENDRRLQSVLENSPMSGLQLLAIGICFVLNMIDGMDVLLISFTSSELESEWGLSKSQLGYIYSAGLFGMMLGSLFIGPYADKFGRRTMLLFATTIVTLGMLYSAASPSNTHMTISRLITGLGIGAMLPTMTAIVSEFANEKRRDLSVGVFISGFPVGAIVTGLFVAWAVPEYGWRFTFASASVISAIMLPIIYFLMPESLDFLADKQPKNALVKINRILEKMGHGTLEALPIVRKKFASSDWRPLLARDMRLATLLLWTGVFFGFLTVYTLISWIPNIARTSGMPFELATYAGTAFNVGAFVGSVIIGWLAVWFGLRRLILTFMLSAFVLMAIYGNVSLPYGIMFVVIIALGIFVQGGFNGFYPASARVYPNEIRATGVGWAIGIGRAGAIFGPALFGILFDRGWDISLLFVVFSVPLLISGVAAFCISANKLR